MANSSISGWLIAPFGKGGIYGIATVQVSVVEVLAHSPRTHRRPLMGTRQRRKLNFNELSAGDPA